MQTFFLGSFLFLFVVFLVVFTLSTLHDIQQRSNVHSKTRQHPHASASSAIYVVSSLTVTAIGVVALAFVYLKDPPIVAVVDLKTEHRVRENREEPFDSTRQEIAKLQQRLEKLTSEREAIEATLRNIVLTKAKKRDQDSPTLELVDHLLPMEKPSLGDFGSNRKSSTIKTAR